MAARTSNAHEQGVATGLVQNAQDAATQIDGVLEHHQRHRRLFEHDVVVFALLLHESLQPLAVLDVLVRRVLGLGVVEVDARENHVWLIADHFFEADLQARVHGFVKGELELLPVLHVGQPVHENPTAFVDPQPQHLLFVLVELCLRQVYALEHLGHVPQVEEVMALGGRGKEILGDIGVQLDGRHRQGLRQGFDVLYAEVIELVRS
mmetsp:Transcript_66770/g.204330  ORF Transcript_66770/g.204330 Transcript_66770/m.204330 type:complete len:207 (-) Transcript_66770:97-717(-)